MTHNGAAKKSREEQSPKQKAMNNGHKPAAVRLTGSNGGDTIYCTFAEMRDGHLYMQDVEYMDDEEIVGEYIPFDKLEGVTRLRSQRNKTLNGER